MKRETLHQKKKRARAIRGNGKEYVDMGRGYSASHLMSHKDKTVWPTVFPNKKGSHKKEDWYDEPNKDKAREEAEKRGETFEFKRKRTAKKFAHGSWKKGKDKRDAMKGFRESNKEDRKKKKAKALSYK
jgi:hypothetical protein